MPSAAPLTGDPGQENCGFELADEPSEPPVNPCTDGTLVFGPETFTRAQGQPLTELRPFSSSEPGGVCILVQNSGVSAAWIGVDGVDIIKPNRFNPHISVLSAMANVPAGEHELSVRLASKPGSELTVEVWFAPVDLTPRDKVVGDEGKVAVWNLYDTPDPFSPGDQDGVEDTTSLSAMVGVMHLGRAKNSSYKLRYTFEIADQADCVQVRSIEGEIPLDPSVVLDGFMVAEEWDGTKDNGDPVGEGDYYYRLVTEVLKEDPGVGVELVDIVVSRIQKVTVDNTPLHIVYFDRFLADTDTYLATETDGGLFIRWNYTNTPRLIWGEGVEFPFDEAGCQQPDLVDRVRCYLSEYDDVFGYGPNAENLLFASISDLKDGKKIIRFNQHLFGVPVEGSDVVVTVNPTGDAILRIYSSFVRGLVSNPVDSAEELPEPPAVTDELIALIESRVGNTYASHRPVKLVFVVDQLLEDTIATPMFTIVVTMTSGNVFRVYLDVGSLEIVKIDDLSKPSNSCGKKIVQSNGQHPEYTEHSCVHPVDCEVIDEDYTCFADEYVLRNTCIQECYDHQTCYDSFDTSWRCIRTGEFAGYCRNPEDTDEHSLIYDGILWLDGFRNNHYFSRSLAVLDQLQLFTCSYIGRDSWDSCGGDIGITLEDPTLFPEIEDAAAKAYLGYIRVFRWSMMDLNDDIEKYARTFKVIGEEGSHNIITSICGPGDPCDQDIHDLVQPCMSENIARFFGSYLTRYILPPNFTWRYPHPGDKYVASGWFDQTCGIDAICGGIEGPNVHIPYSHRSRYDWLWCESTPKDPPNITTEQDCIVNTDCPPYYTCYYGKCAGSYRYENNTAIWRRFARLLAEGSSTFIRDGHDEDIGLSFSGVGDELATQISYEMLLNLNIFSTPQDVAELLLSAGSFQQPTKTTELRYSLGATGFPGGNFYMDGGISTDRPPMMISFNNWNRSTIKTWYIYKDKNTYHLKARYHDGANWVTTTVYDSSTRSTPKAVVFNGWLHIFWRELDTNSIMLVSVDQDGNWSPIHDLSGMGLITDRPLDVNVFNDALYLGFSRPGDGHLHIAKCPIAYIWEYGYCTSDSDDWETYGVDKFKRLNSCPTEGVAMTSGAGLHGVENQGEEYLYALLSDPNRSARLSVAMIDSADEHVGIRDIPATHPQYRAVSFFQRGLEMKPSAFTDAGQYLYLSWSWLDDQIYTSVLQNWSHFSASTPERERAWFTRSVTLGELCHRGVTLGRHDSDSVIRHVYTSIAKNEGYHSVTWGRY